MPQTDSSTRQRLLDRINSKIRVDPGGCHIWTGVVTSRRRADGYGLIHVIDRMKLVHRVLYEIKNGPIPEGLTLDHLCRNRNCVNPEHMEPASLRENILRGCGASAVHARKTHCPRGHPYDEENTHRYNGARYCRKCKRIRDRQRYTKHKG